VLVQHCLTSAHLRERRRFSLALFYSVEQRAGAYCRASLATTGWYFVSIKSSLLACMHCLAGEVTMSGACRWCSNSIVPLRFWRRLCPPAPAEPQRVFSNGLPSGILQLDVHSIKRLNLPPDPTRSIALPLIDKCGKATVQYCSLYYNVAAPTLTAQYSSCRVSLS